MAPFAQGEAPSTSACSVRLRKMYCNREILKRILENNEKILDNNNEMMLRMAIMALGHLARVATISEIEELQQSYLPTALSWLSDFKSEVHRYCGALLVRQFAINSPEIIFATRTIIRDDLFDIMWELVGDRNKFVRNAAKEALEEILVLVSQRESVYKYIRLALVKINEGLSLKTNILSTSSSLSSSTLSSKDNEKVIGALIIYNIMLNGRVVPTSELISIMREMGISVEESISGPGRSRIQHHAAPRHQRQSPISVQHERL